MQTKSNEFQFTHPVRGATPGGWRLSLQLQVSIHAPRAGCDIPELEGFYKQDMFQFTHPVRGATASKTPWTEFMTFQFTHPVRGATDQNTTNKTIVPSFNSRTPCGVRPPLLRWGAMALPFQFTHPVRGAT